MMRGVSAKDKDNTDNCDSSPKGKIVKITFGITVFIRRAQTESFFSCSQ